MEGRDLGARAAPLWNLGSGPRLYQRASRSAVLRIGTGTVRPAKAHITANGQPVDVTKGGHFAQTIQLGQDIGHHQITVHATLRGFQPATVEGKVIR